MLLGKLILVNIIITIIVKIKTRDTKITFDNTKKLKQYFKKILNQNTNIFYFFGLSSAVFLFAHVYFLGTTSNNEILKDFRRIITLLFILFEVFAQSLLAYKIYNNKNIFFKYCFNLLVVLKLIFVSFVLIFTISVITMLSIFNFPSNI